MKEMMKQVSKLAIKKKKKSKTEIINYSNNINNNDNNKNEKHVGNIQLREAEEEKRK